MQLFFFFSWTTFNFTIAIRTYLHTYAQYSGLFCLSCLYLCFPHITEESSTNGKGRARKIMKKFSLFFYCCCCLWMWWTRSRERDECKEEKFLFLIFYLCWKFYFLVSIKQLKWICKYHLVNALIVNRISHASNVMWIWISFSVSTQIDEKKMQNPEFKLMSFDERSNDSHRAKIFYCIIYSSQSNKFSWNQYWISAEMDIFPFD